MAGGDMKRLAQLTIDDVFKQLDEIRVVCTECKESFIWCTVNVDPDFCPLCGEELDAAVYTNPERKETI